MSGLQQETFVLAGCRLQVTLTAVAAEKFQSTMPFAHALLMLRQLTRERRAADGLQRLLWHACPSMGTAKPSATQIEALLVRLLRAQQLRLDWAPPRALAVNHASAPVAVARTERCDSDGRLSMFTTALRLRAGIDAHEVAAPVQVSSALRGGSGTLVRPDSVGLMAVPDALDDGHVLWQLQHLLEATRQGTLETWGVPAGEGNNPGGGA